MFSLLVHQPLLQVLVHLVLPHHRHQHQQRVQVRQQPVLVHLVHQRRQQYTNESN